MRIFDPLKHPRGPKGRFIKRQADKPSIVATAILAVAVLAAWAIL